MNILLDGVFVLVAKVRKMKCPNCGKDEFKMVEYKKAEKNRNSFGVFACSVCGYREVIK